MNTLRSKQANSAIIGIYHLLLTVSILAALYFGQDIIIPLALASLLIFLLAPLATRVERHLYFCKHDSPHLEYGVDGFIEQTSNLQTKYYN
jgi:predicted PurR-regulated permease PerM